MNSKGVATVKQCAVAEPHYHLYHPNSYEHKDSTKEPCDFDPFVLVKDGDTFISIVNGNVELKEHLRDLETMEIAKRVIYHSGSNPSLKHIIGSGQTFSFASQGDRREEERVRE